LVCFLSHPGNVHHPPARAELRRPDLRQTGGCVPAVSSGGCPRDDRSDHRARGHRMNLMQDLRFALRLLIKDRWFTAVAVIALALRIGVNATVVTFVNAVLIRGLPFNDPDRIVLVASRDARGRDRSASYLDFQDWRESART